jgi:hypothetical protein
MYGLLTEDLAKAMAADREREIARLLAERAACDSWGMPSLRDRMKDAALGLLNRHRLAGRMPAAPAPTPS